MKTSYIYLNSKKKKKKEMWDRRHLHKSSSLTVLKPSLLPALDQISLGCVSKDCKSTTSMGKTQSGAAILLVKKEH